MIFSKDEILMESTFVSDMVRIEYATDAMLDHYLESALYLENAKSIADRMKKAIGGIKTMIQTAIERLQKFISDKIEMWKRSKEMKKLKDVLDSNMVNAINHMDPSVKVICPDVKKIDAKLAKAFESYTILSNIMVKEMSRISKLSGVKLETESNKYEKYIETVSDRVGSIYDDCIDLLNEHREVPVSKALKEIQLLPATIQNAEKLEAALKESGITLTKTLDDYEIKSLVPTQNDITTVEDGTKKLSVTKRLINMTLNRISYFTHKHASVISRLLNVGAAVLAMIPAIKSQYEDMNPSDAAMIAGAGALAFASNRVKNNAKVKPKYRLE